jgi:ABC-type spermidine/putrescine transport system permease subunit II
VRRWEPGRWLADPWRRRRPLETLVWAYLAWSILPVTIAVWFSFNAGRSRSSWQGFATVVRMVIVGSERVFVVACLA